MIRRAEVEFYYILFFFFFLTKIRHIEVTEHTRSKVPARYAIVRTHISENDCVITEMYNRSSIGNLYDVVVGYFTVGVD